MSGPIIYYFPIRGRAEPLRLALASQGVEFKEEDGRESLKDLSKFQFGQARFYC